VAPIAYAIFSDGALLATYPDPIPPPPPGTVLADTADLWRIPDAGGEPVLLSRVAGPRWFWTGQFMLPVPFTTAALHASAGERLVTAAGDVPEVQVHGPDGRLMARYRVARGRIYGVVKDSLDVQTVQVFRIRKPAGPGA
jgi:hypothetical protein